MAGDFVSKVVAVTGGSSGIGLATAAIVLRESGRVALLGRDRRRLDAAAKRLADRGARRESIIVFAGDAGDEGAVAEFVSVAKAQFGRIDGFAACVGAGDQFDLLSGAVSDWQRILAANLTPALLAGRVAATTLEPGGALVLVGSMSSVRSASTVSMPYAVAKGGIPVLTRGLAATLAPGEIRVNCVIPGWVDTPMSRAGLRAAVGDSQIAQDETRAGVAARLPLGRIGTAAELGELIAFLLSTRASYLTGSVVVADGGELAAFGEAPPTLLPREIRRPG